MADLVVIVGVLAFFGICAAYVTGCDRIIGPDVPEGPVAGERDEVASVPGTGA